VAAFEHRKNNQPKPHSTGVGHFSRTFKFYLKVCEVKVSSFVKSSDSFQKRKRQPHGSQLSPTPNAKRNNAPLWLARQLPALHAPVKPSVRAMENPPATTC